jgi:hypothetical protein
MGMALTYARRYALFTLVGIAGEDDLDAPDLAAPAGQASGMEKPTDTRRQAVATAKPSRVRRGQFWRRTSPPRSAINS